MMREAVVLGISLVIATAVSSCGHKIPDAVTLVGFTEQLESSNGVLLAVTLKEQTGISHKFQVAPDRLPNVDLAHLEIHRTMRIPVTLRLEFTAGSLYVIAIDD
jgi:hypothetical protein